LPQGQVLSETDQPIEDREHGVTITLRNDGAQHIALIRGFDSEASAFAYLNRTWAGRAWALLTYGVVAIVEERMSNVAWASDPEQAARNLEGSMGLRYKGPIDGIADGDNPIVYHNEKRLRFASVGNPTVTIGTPAAMYFGAFLEGMQIGTMLQEAAPPRLRTALDLYAAHFTEASANARFLTLVMCLEALTDSRPKHAVALRLLEQWREQLQRERAQYEKDSEEHSALEALDRELFHRVPSEGSVHWQPNPRVDLRDAGARRCR
jgi:hypothetical protein